jgi:GT2 family glycosyltransferase
MTDDDCEVTSGWLRGMAAAFQLDERIGVVFGNALAGDHDRTAGFIPAFRCTEPLMAWGVENKHRIEGIGACMGIRRSLWVALGGFDCQLGAGAPFISAEDLDFAVRCLQAGCPLFATPDASVIHHGLRIWADGPTLITGYLFGIGAMFAKHLKLGRWSVVTLMWRLASRWAFAGPVVDLGHKPPRWLRLKAFTRGFLQGLRTPVDHSSAHYAPLRALPVPGKASQ